MREESEANDAAISHAEDSIGDTYASYELALVRVMMGRAAVAVAHKGLVEETIAEGAHYRMCSSKPSAYLTAYLRIAQEYRRFRKLLGDEERDRDRAAALTEKEEEPSGGFASLMLPILEKAGDILEEVVDEEREEQQREWLGKQGDNNGDALT